MSSPSQERSLAVRFPHLAKQWHPSLNGVLTPHNVSFGSSKEVYWLCDTCAYVWKGTVNYRTHRKSGCAACINQVVTDKNRLSLLYPDISEEFDEPTMCAGDYTTGSGKIVFWKCKTCQHRWKARVRDRIKKGYGCPSCSGRIVSDKNRLSLLRPDVCLEWNDKTCTPEEVTVGSNKIVEWKCKICNHEWPSTIANRTCMDHGCPRCALILYSHGTSKTEQKLVQAIKHEFGIPKDVFIQERFNPDKNILERANELYSCGFMKAHIKPDITLDSSVTNFKRTIFIEYDSTIHDDESRFRKDKAKSMILLDNRTNVVIRVRHSRLGPLGYNFQEGELYFEVFNDCTTDKQIQECVMRIRKILHKHQLDE